MGGRQQAQVDRDFRGRLDRRQGNRSWLQPPAFAGKLGVRRTLALP
jgi:hypothetical protein